MQHDYIRLLIKSAQQGKKNAYRELCNANLKKIYNLSLRITLNKNIAEILTQNIFIEAWENIKFLREGQAFDIWLKSIAVYKIFDEMRTSKIKNDLVEKGIITENDFSVLSSDKFENLILLLPDKERIAFILHDIEEYTYEEISDFIDDMTTLEIKNMIRSTRNSLINTPDYD